MVLKISPFNLRVFPSAQPPSVNVPLACHARLLHGRTVGETISMAPCRTTVRHGAGSAGVDRYQVILPLVIRHLATDSLLLQELSSVI